MWVNSFLEIKLTLLTSHLTARHIVNLDYSIAEIPQCQREKVELRGRFLSKIVFYRAMLILDVLMDISGITLRLTCGEKALCEHTMDLQ